LVQKNPEQRAGPATVRLASGSEASDGRTIGRTNLALLELKAPDLNEDRRIGAGRTVQNPFRSAERQRRLSQAGGMDKVG